jgi:hypothetical protein
MRVSISEDDGRIPLPSIVCVDFSKSVGT